MVKFSVELHNFWGALWLVIQLTAVGCVVGYGFGLGAQLSGLVCGR